MTLHKTWKFGHYSGWKLLGKKTKQLIQESYKDKQLPKRAHQHWIILELILFSYPNKDLIGCKKNEIEVNLDSLIQVGLN